MREEQKLKHPSYGTVVVSRCINGRFDRMFRSSVETDAVISLTIHQASVRRTELGDYVHPEEVVVGVDFTPLQWAELLSSMGQGGGVACTIDQIGGTKIEDPPFEETEAKRVARRLVADMQGLPETVKKAVQLIEDALAKGGRMNAADRKSIEDATHAMAKLMTDSAPFAVRRIEEHLDRMASEAKAIVDEHAHRVRSGLPLPASIAAGNHPARLEPGFPGYREEQEPRSVAEREAEEAEEPEPPVLPTLPEREIDVLEVDQLRRDQLATRIARALHKLERDPLINREGSKGGKNKLKWLYMSTAWASGKGIHVKYVSYQSHCTLSVEDAREYLTGLEHGAACRHYEFFAKRRDKVTR